MIILRAALYLFGAFAIIALAVVPNIFPMGYHTDKVLHIFTFGITMMLLTIKFYSQRKLIIFILALITLGAAIEMVQSFTPDRAAQWEDFIANIAGISFGLITGHLLRSGYYK